jgi:hypothetical protein
VTEAFRADAFRAEVRDWLARHVPASPLPSLDTAEGRGERCYLAGECFP